jgi:putative SOS response-associated peptidase YedK
MAEVEGDPLALLRHAAEDVLRIRPVGHAVNAPRNNGPELLAPGAPGHAAS